MIIKQATTNSEINRCFGIMSELRPHLKKELFLETIRIMEDQGFKLAYLDDSGDIVAVVGYKIANNLFLGKHLYIEDLVTSKSARSKGYGQKLYDWVREEGKKSGCDYIHLDSAVHRGDAHRFYFRQGLTISSFHFRERLD